MRTRWRRSTTRRPPTSAGRGSGTTSYSATLHACGVRIVGVIADNDDTRPVNTLMMSLASCRAAGLIATVIQLPDLPPKGDVSDYLATHTPAELEAIITTALASRHRGRGRRRAIDRLSGRRPCRDV